MKKIPLTQGKFALVDDADFDWLNQWKWYFNGLYAVRTVRAKNIKKTIIMHREILNTPADMDTDHKDGDGLNNQRKNIRICTTAQNMRNKRKYHGSTSKFKGVSWDSERRKWMSAIHVNGKNKYLGRYPSEVEAAKAYDDAALTHFGDFSKLNRAS